MEASYTGKVITEKRKELGLTQKELADKLGVTDKAVSRWENGLNFPDIAIMQDLAQALDISVVELLGAEDNTGEQLIRDMAQISASEKRRIVKDIIQRGWLTAVLGLLFLAVAMYLCDVLDQNQLTGAPRWASSFIVGFSGLVAGNGLYSVIHGKRLL